MGTSKLTRRQWAAAVAAAQTAAAAAANAQVQQSADSPAELLTQARQTVQRNRETLAKFKIDRSLEPAVRFEA